MARTWTSSDPRWQALNPYQRAAAMALMEADRMDPASAKNALAAMVNRAAKEGVDLGQSVSGPAYQPTIEPAQQARLDRILQSPAFTDLTGWAERRASGREPDPVSGATHFLAPERTMLDLERQNPAKYRNWGPRGANWTGYDPATGSYKGVVMRDNSHAFLAPEGANSVPGQAPQVNAAQNGGISGGQAQPAPAAIAAPAAPAQSPDLSSLIAQMFSGASGTPTAPQQGGVAGALASLSPDEAGKKVENPYPTLSATEMPALPQSMRRPVDLGRLREVLASRARLGTA